MYAVLPAAQGLGRANRERDDVAAELLLLRSETATTDGCICVSTFNRRRGGAESRALSPLTVMVSLDELDGWEDLEDEERERVRALLRDLGLHLDVLDDPDVVE